MLFESDLPQDLDELKRALETLSSTPTPHQTT
jgi:hypothetical protein